MPGFRYKAVDKDGKPLRGVLEASDHDDAKRRIENRGWRPGHVTMAKLPPRRAPSELVPPPSGSGLKMTLVLLFLLVAALAAFIWFDPYELGLVDLEFLRQR